MKNSLNIKFSILCLSILALPSCAPFKFRRQRTVVPIQQQLLPKKAYLCIDDIECEDCFSLIQGILSSIKGVCNVSLEQGYDPKTAGTQRNRVVISYDPAINLNKVLIKMMLEEWTFELQKIDME